MKIRLLRNVYQNGVLKTTVRHKKQEVIGWFKGKEIEVSDATGAKLIESGDAEEVKAEPAPAAVGA